MYISLTEVVNNYLLSTFNDSRKYYLNYLVHAKWIWKKIFLQNLYAVRTKMLKVDKSTQPYRIVRPLDMERFINVSVTDQNGRLRSLHMDDQMRIPPPGPNACDRCNEVDYIAPALAFTLCTKEVIIEGQAYIEKNWKQLNPDGSVLLIRQVPVQDYSDLNTWTIKYETIEKVICKLDMKPCGCIAHTDENKQKVIDYCGCTVQVPELQLLSKPYQRFGTIKVDSQYIYLQGDVPDYVDVTWQTNGECPGEEIMVPELAVNAMIFGINWRARALNPNGNRLEIRELERLFEKQLYELDSFLNPVREEEWMAVQMSIPRWGHAGTGVSEGLSETWPPFE